MSSLRQQAGLQAQRQWNANPCGAVATEAYDADFFARVEQERYRQQYWQLDYFEYGAFAGGKVLEIGIGLGTDLKQFARRGAECFGVDITDRHLELTQRNFDLSGFPVTLLKASAAALPFPDNYFDGVYSFGVLHHIPDVDQVLAEVRRVLKPGGRLQIAVYHKHSADAWVLMSRAVLTGSLFRLGVAGILATIEKGADGAEIKPYVKLYSRGELRRRLERAGFVRPRLGVRHFSPDSRSGRWLQRVRRLERCWGWYVCAQARKPSA